MRTMMMIVLSMVMISLVSCRNIAPQLTRPLERCRAYFNLDVCRCSCYDIREAASVDAEKCGFDFDTTFFNRELEYCNDFTGFSLNDWALVIRPTLEDLRDRGVWLEKNQKEDLKKLENIMNDNYK